MSENRVNNDLMTLTTGGKPDTIMFAWTFCMLIEIAANFNHDYLNPSRKLSSEKTFLSFSNFIKLFQKRISELWSFTGLIEKQFCF